MSARVHSGLLIALQGIEELVQLVQAVCSSIWLKPLLEVVVYTLGVIVVNVVSIVLCEGRACSARGRHS